MENASPKYGRLSGEGRLKLIGSLLDAHLQLLAKIAQSDHAQQRTGGVASALAIAAADSCVSLSILAQRRQLRDAYVVTRTIADTLLNVVYVEALGDPAVERAHKHSLQKAYRDMDRELEIAGFKVGIRQDSKPDAAAVKGLVEALELFTTSKKRAEITSWAEHVGWDKKIDAIAGKVDMGVVRSLTMVFFHCYRHSSEIAHGTYYGAQYALGQQYGENGPDKSNLMAKFDDDLCLLIMMVHVALAATIRVHNAGQGDGEELVKASEEILHAVMEAVRVGLGSGDDGPSSNPSNACSAGT